MDIMDAAIKGFTRTKHGWDHKLKIKDIFAGWDAIPPKADTERMALAIIAAIDTQLVPHIGGALKQDIAGVLEAFRAVAGAVDDKNASFLFNAALDVLYDQGDYLKRVWIE